MMQAAHTHTRTWLLVTPSLLRSHSGEMGMLRLRSRSPCKHAGGQWKTRVGSFTAQVQHAGLERRTQRRTCLKNSSSRPCTQRRCTGSALVRWPCAWWRFGAHVWVWRHAGDLPLDPPCVRPGRLTRSAHLRAICRLRTRSASLTGCTTSTGPELRTWQNIFGRGSHAKNEGKAHN